MQRKTPAQGTPRENCETPSQHHVNLMQINGPQISVICKTSPRVSGNYVVQNHKFVNSTQFINTQFCSPRRPCKFRRAHKSQFVNRLPCKIMARQTRLPGITHPVNVNSAEVTAAPGKPNKITLVAVGVHVTVAPRAHKRQLRESRSLRENTALAG